MPGAGVIFYRMKVTLKQLYLCEAMATDSSSSSSVGSPSPSPQKGILRPSRSKKLPAKLRELEQDEPDLITFEELEFEQSSKSKVR